MCCNTEKDFMALYVSFTHKSKSTKTPKTKRLGRTRVLHLLTSVPFCLIGTCYVPKWQHLRQKGFCCVPRKEGEVLNLVGNCEILPENRER